MSTNIGSMDFAQASFWDGVSNRSGFLAIQTSGQTGTTGLAICRLTSVGLNIDIDSISLQSFENNFTVSTAPTNVSFSLDVEGYYVGTGATANGYSGYTSYVVGKLTGEQLMDYALGRRADLTAFVKMGGKVKKGKVVITNYKVAPAVGEAMTFTATLTGNGSLEHVAG